MTDMIEWKFYLFLSLLFIVVQGVFAMLEIACVSFNRVRLQYYVSLNLKRAKWLNYLINRPALLFGTCLIGVNAAMQIGSECARRFYEGVGMMPELAPISQIILVLILAEFAPMLTGRRYAEHVVMLGVPIIYFASIILRPLIWLFDLICQFINRLLGISTSEGSYLTREELQYMFEQREEVIPTAREMSSIASNIFALKNQQAKDAMIPLHKVYMAPDFFTVGETRALLRSHYDPYVPLYHRNPENVVGIVYPRDLLRSQEGKSVKEFARAPWFITEKSSIMQILKQFRSNNQSVAIVLNDVGSAVGVLTLDEIIDDIFGRADTWNPFENMIPKKQQVFLDVSLPSDMKIEEFNKRFSVYLDPQGVETLEELMEKVLEHAPERGESVRIDQFELTVEAGPLIGPKVIAVKTLY